MLEFTATKEEAKTIMQIVGRAVKLGTTLEVLVDPMQLAMDIEACHCNGCPLKLDALLKARDSDFGHDVFGIRRYLDRETGKLTRCFLPRYAEPEPAHVP